MDQLELSDSVVVAGTPEAIYEMVTDVTRMGEWSPVCKECWWEDPDGGPRVGARFHGRNETPDRTWETVSTIVAAEPGREVAWVVNANWVRWSYHFEPADEGTTKVTETWKMLPAGLEGFRERYGEHADEQVAQRREAARAGIPRTLAALAAAARSEAGA